MTVRSVPIFLQAGSHPAEETRLMLGGMLGTATGSFAGGVASSDPAHGVVRPGDFAVTQNGTPNMSVNVAAGGAFIRGTQNANQGAYHVWNDGTVNLPISAADVTNGRRDLVIAQVRDSAYSGADDDARITVVTGTPAAVPADPSLASFPNALVLARITVAAGDTAINTADITDLRPVANQIGKIPTFDTSALATTAIPSPVDGQAYYLNSGTATEGPLWWNGSAYRLPWSQPWGVMAHFQTTSTYARSSTTLAEINTAYRLTINATANRLLKFTFTGNYSNATGGGLVELYNVTNSVVVSRVFQHNLTIGDGLLGSGVVIADSIAGSKTYTLRWQTVTGGTINIGSAGLLSQFTIQDIGPWGAPA
jgi:hypothetical protein